VFGCTQTRSRYSIGACSLSNAHTYEAVAKAIEDMVTQSGGPFLAASAAMVLAAREAATADLAGSELQVFMGKAAARLIATRPTNNETRVVVTRLMSKVEEWSGSAVDLAAMLEDQVSLEWENRLTRARAVGRHAASGIAEGARLLTHCWGDSVVIATLEALIDEGKNFSIICTETRPYLQGSRLTAESIAEMGIPVRVVTDGMGATLMAQGEVDHLLTAADRVTLDGSVINKIGTLQLAIAADHFGIPYTALVESPDQTAEGPDDVPIEYRDGEEVLHCLGQRTASYKATGIYPAFDVTQPGLVSRIATSDGSFKPGDIAAYYRPTTTYAPDPSLTSKLP